MPVKINRLMIFALIIFLFAGIVGCSNNNGEQKTPSKTPINNQKETPIEGDDEKYKISYYLDDVLIYEEKSTKAKNYNLKAPYLILGWYTDNETDIPYDFPNKIDGDISLYAHSYPIEDALDQYFEKNAITEIYFEGNSETTNYLKLVKTTEPVELRGTKYPNESGYLFYYYNYQRKYVSVKDDLHLYEQACWDFKSGNFIIFNEYYNLYAEWPRNKYDFYSGILKYKYSGYDKLEIIDTLLSTEYLEKNEIKEYLYGFANKAFAHFSILVDKMRSELFEGKYSTAPRYTLSISIKLEDNN